MVIAGGGWLVVLPLVVLLVENGHLALPWRSGSFVAVGGLALGTGVLLAWVAGYYLIVKGRGTPFPLDPTQRLVITGPYAYVRNPQAIAMALMVSGEILAVQSYYLWLLLPLTLFYLEVLVGPWEERQLFRQHSEQYIQYRRRVRKWLPLLSPYHTQKELSNFPN
jgi:protein-S-isoprenylcysteine O-methyltransferase Ste14